MRRPDDPSGWQRQVIRLGAILGIAIPPIGNTCFFKCLWEGSGGGREPEGELSLNLRTLALPAEMATWSLTTLREKLVKIG